MKLLKQKIQASLQASKKAGRRNQRNNTKASDSSEGSFDKPGQSAKKPNTSQPKRRRRRNGHCFTPKIYLQTKNIVANFGRAIASFASSELASPYLASILEKLAKEGEDVQVEKFMEFIEGRKSNINSIESLRSLTLEHESDGHLELLCKKVFRQLAEIFIKYFSVNWIIHGRVTYKMIHLKFRFKMLRRIQNPTMFTYLKGSCSSPREE